MKHHLLERIARLLGLADVDLRWTQRSLQVLPLVTARTLSATIRNVATKAPLRSRGVPACVPSRATVASMSRSGSERTSEVQPFCGFDEETEEEALACDVNYRTRRRFCTSGVL